MSNLRIRRWPEEDVANVRSYLAVHVPRRRAQLLPLRIGPKCRPVLVMRRHVVEYEHIGQVGKTLANQCFPKEDRLQSRAPEDGDLSRIEHLDLLLIGLLA